MSRPVNPIICDGCGKTKAESNNWFTAITWEGIDGFTIEPAAAGAAENLEPGETLHDLCGQECVLRFVSEQMGKQANG